MAPTPSVQARGIRPIGPPPRGVPPTSYEGFHPGDAGPTAEYVAPAVSRVQACYQGSYSVNTSCAAVPFDAVALGAQSRPVPYYRGSASAVSNAADQDPGRMALVTVSRPQAAPQVSRSQAINVYDNPTATPLDAWPAATASRQQGSYQGSYSLNIGAAAVPFDSAVLGSQSRPVAFYTPPCSRVIQAFTSNAVVSTDWVTGISSRPQGLYRGAPSSVSGAADQDPGVMAFLAQSRPTTFYLAPRSRAISVFDAPVIVPDTFASATQSRRVDFYSPPRSLAISPAVVVVPDTWAATTQSRSVPWYRGSASVVGIVVFVAVTLQGGGTSTGTYIDPFRDPFRDPLRDSSTTPFRDPFRGKD